MLVGVLALQGAFAEHISMLRRLGADCVELRQKADLRHDIDALVLPGGESTVQGKLLRELDMFDTLRSAINGGLPVLGTCAGLLLLAKDIQNDDRRHFATMDITAVRNAYGRQLGSFNAEAELKGIGRVPMTFIRAPYISRVGSEAEILAETNGRIVAARQGNQLVTAFHPELTDDTRVHELFLSMVW